MDVITNLNGKKISSDLVQMSNKHSDTLTQSVFKQYSTSEQWTGKYWIDGKKIYTISFTTGSSAISTTKSFTIKDASTLFFIADKSYVKTGNTIIYLPRASVSTASNQIAVQATDNIFKLITGNSISYDSGWITVEYTCANR